MRPGCRFRPVDPVPPLDQVQVQLEDPALVQLRFEPPRDEHLAKLAHGILRWREVQVLCELLRDRAGATHELAPLDVDLQRLADLPEVDPGVSPESGVLRHDNRTRQVRRDAVVAHPPVHAPGRLPLRACLGRPQLHERGGRRIRRAQRPDVWKRDVDVRGTPERHRRKRGGSACRLHQRAGSATPLRGQSEPPGTVMGRINPDYPSTTILMRCPGFGCCVGS